MGGVTPQHKPSKAEGPPPWERQGIPAQEVGGLGQREQRGEEAGGGRSSRKLPDKVSVYLPNQSVAISSRDMGKDKKKNEGELNKTMFLESGSIS